MKMIIKKYGLILLSLFCIFASILMLLQSNYNEDPNPVGRTTALQTKLDGEGSSNDPEIIQITQALQEDIPKGPAQKFDAKLVDTSKGLDSPIKGIVYVEYRQGEYQLEGEFNDLPSLNSDQYYEGWLVQRDPYSVKSTGRIQMINGKLTNKFSSTVDYRPYTTYLLTLQKLGDTAPQLVMLEGIFFSEQLD